MENLHPSELIQNMAFVLQPSGWVFFQNDIVYKAEHYEGQRLTSDLSPGFWIHAGDASWIRFFFRRAAAGPLAYFGTILFGDRKRAFVHRILFSTYKERTQARYSPHRKSWRGKSNRCRKPFKTYNTCGASSPRDSPKCLMVCW